MSRAICLRTAAAFAVAARVIAASVIATSAARADGDAMRGEKKFEECAACHKLNRAEDGLGPSLHGVFGRKAASLAEFHYSGALKRSGITWTPQAVDTFIADPQAAVPANRMPYAGLTNAADRADLIAYLQKTFK
jgi:cytochrome c2